MTDAGDRLLGLVPGFIGLGVASKFLDKASGNKKSKGLPKDIFNIWR